MISFSLYLSIRLNALAQAGQEVERALHARVEGVVRRRVLVFVRLAAEEAQKAALLGRLQRRISALTSRSDLSSHQVLKQPVRLAQLVLLQHERAQALLRAREREQAVDATGGQVF